MASDGNPRKASKAQAELRMIACLLVVASLIVTAGMVRGFHESSKLPVAEPWFVILAFLPFAALAVVHMLSTSPVAVACVAVPLLIHDGTYFVSLLTAQPTWVLAIYWRASHGLMLLFFLLPAVLLSVWRALRRRRSIR